MVKNTFRKSLADGLWYIAGILFLVLCWHIFSLIVASELIIPSPLAVLNSLLRTSWGLDFRMAVFGSLYRVLVALLISVPSALVIGLAAAFSRRFKLFLQPLFSLLGATPVLSIILISLLWFGQEGTPVFTAFLMIFPVMAASVIQGGLSVDAQLLEMATLYKFPLRQRLIHVYIPSIVPFIHAGLRSSLSLCWKVVVAAEVIAQPFRSLGAAMQNAKAQLETAELFSWTLVTVSLAALTELVLPLGRFVYRKIRSSYASRF